MRYSYTKFLCFLAFGLVLMLGESCSPEHFVKPLEKGQTSVGASLGGPLIGFAGTTIPMPLTSVTVGHGYSETLTGFASLHTTALLFGDIQTDIGIVKSFAAPQGWRPGFSVSPAANLMIDTREGHFRFFPQLDLNAYWDYGQRKSFVYFGMFNWFGFEGYKLHDQLQPKHWVPGFQLGNTFVRPKWNYTLEMKYIAPFYSNEDIVVDYKSFGNTGAIGAYFGISRKF